MKTADMTIEKNLQLSWLVMPDDIVFPSASPMLDYYRTKIVVLHHGIMQHKFRCYKNLEMDFQEMEVVPFCKELAAHLKEEGFDSVLLSANTNLDSELKQAMEEQDIKVLYLYYVVTRDPSFVTADDNPVVLSMYAAESPGSKKVFDFYTLTNHQ